MDRTQPPRGHSSLTMRKFILMILLTIVSSSAMAEWAAVAEGGETLTAYVDFATIRKVGDSVKMWSTFNYKLVNIAADGKPYRSAKLQFEFECKEEQSRTLFFSFHSGNMGKGNVVYVEDKPQNFAPVPPDTIMETLWKVACSKR